MITLSEISLDMLELGKGAIITYIDDRLRCKKRILDLGFTQDSEVKKLRKSPLGDPTAYLIKGTLIALRNEDARYIKVSII